MKNKKILIVTIISIVVILGAIIYLFGFGMKNSNTLTLEENKYIDENKYNVIDVAVLNDIPVLSYEGEGLVYNYLDFVTKNYNLKFNIVPYKYDGTSMHDYKLEIVSEVNKNNIEILKDNMILLSNNNIKYNDVSEINNLKIGVLTSDIETVSNYIGNQNITYIEYSNYDELKNSIINTSDNTLIDTDPQTLQNEVDAIVILKTLCVKEIVENDLTIAYHFNDLNKSFVLTTNGNTNLNNIFAKSFNVWKMDEFEEKYNSYLVLNYYEFEKLTDSQQKTLKSKNYVYGFINYGVYNYLDGKNISGLNGLILKDFNKFSGLSITYTQYNSVSKLISDFNSDKVDFMFNLVSEEKFQKNIYKTVNVLDKKLLIVSDVNSNHVIDNLKSLKNKEVLMVKDTYIEKILKENSIKYKSYNNLEEMVSDFSAEDILLIDVENYNFYKTNYLKNSRINYIVDLEDDYNFIINDKESNKIFKDMFNFYLSFNSINKLITKGYEDVAYQSVNVVYILLIVLAILVIYVVLDFYNHIKKMLKTIKQSTKIKLTKEEKIMYIDQLTSLKNRAYLNSRIESWDESEVYPQCIIVIDLNNISYVNDNYGREEGDKVITEAANILIQNQLSNTEIIRTDGNEFLIYLVGYSEKQVVSYLRKLNKEFKNLSHGFGAASGYSIISDAIKTIDDAVNEATIAMKENKEDIDY